MAHSVRPVVVVLLFGRSVGRSAGRLVGQSVCHNFLKGQEALVGSESQSLGLLVCRLVCHNFLKRAE